MEVRVKDETFVFDVELTNGESEVITVRARTYGHWVDARMSP